MDSLRFLVDCESDHPWTAKVMYIRSLLPTLFCGYFFGQIARQSEEGKWITNPTGKASRMKMMKVDRFPDIFFGAPIPFQVSKTHIKYPTVLLNRKTDDPVIEGKPSNVSLLPTNMSLGLQLAYQSYQIQPHTLSLTASTVSFSADDRRVVHLPRLEWWESISYYDTISEAMNRIRLEDFIIIDEKCKKSLTVVGNREGFKDVFAKVLGKLNSTCSEQYRRRLMNGPIAGICTHHHSGSNYVFIYVQWLVIKEVLESKDKLGLNIYDLQPMCREGNIRWTNFVSKSRHSYGTIH